MFSMEMVSLVLMMFLVLFSSVELLMFLVLSGLVGMKVSSTVMISVSLSPWAFQESYSSYMVILVYLVFFMVLSISYAESGEKMYKLINYMMMMILVYLFYSKLFLEFYAWFEVSLIPISLIIMGWGYQPERLPAFMNIMLYTMVCSLPFLLVILIFSVNNLEGSSLWKSSNQVIFIESMIISIAFLVKFPMFFLHVWLPKAHVEAPVGGSMVLAGLLLKMGGFGVFMLAPFLSSGGVLFLVLSLALGGGAVVSILCLRQVDSKTLVAYSSVAHMALVISGMMSMTQLGVVGSFMVMFAHGVTSSAMFYMIYMVYLSYDSRNLILSKSLLICQPVLTMYMFILCASNMGAPPFFNLLAELCCAVVVGSMSVMNFWLLGVLFFFAVAFNLVLYLYMSHGQNYSGAQDLKAISVMSNFVFLLHLVWTFLSLGLVSTLV